MEDGTKMRPSTLSILLFLPAFLAPTWAAQGEREFAEPLITGIDNNSYSSDRSGIDVRNVSAARFHSKAG